MRATKPVALADGAPRFIPWPVSDQACHPVPVLSRADIGAFLADGYFAVRGAVPTRVAAACREVIWAELSQRGVRPDDPATWIAPVVRISCPGGARSASAARIIAQPAVALHGQYALRALPGTPPPPVE